ncbi:GMC oxidoreductase-like protein [Podospora fimiseda]|uniref:GMC oxidoreductase-like protein n=1 Tax=Podospora fimiseda TaxID=252190 RepID=A0AAN7BDE7_9PEZI|nr:GMC oxidoreductase-like protein [Podospora fimiseda]
MHLYQVFTSVIGLFCALTQAYPNILQRTEDLKTEYDYVIVGGGTSGLTVADRLTENGRYSVLVLERGIFRNSTFVTTVNRGFFGILDPANFFNFSSVPQPLLNGRTVSVIGGQMLGGSSGVNGFQVLRGQKEDYDRWGQYFGPKSDWSWNGLLPYFNKAWNFHPPSRDLQQHFNIKYDTKFWGSTSKIHASFPTFSWPILKTQMEAIGDIPGVKFPSDSGSGETGAYWHPSSVDPSVVLRSFARTGHWDGIESSRSNYHTLTGQKVLKVLFQGKKATGVSFVAADATSQAGARTVKAKKEVIIAAGTLHTPQILQASGIGPKDLLRQANINVVVDLPGVGANFQDQPFNIGAFFNLTTWNIHPDADDLWLNNETFIAEAQAEFDANRTGPNTIASGNSGAWLPLNVVSPTKFRDIAARYEAQNPASYLPAGTDKTVIAGYQAQKKAKAKALKSSGSAIYNFFFTGRAQRNGAIVFLHPTSRGTVLINPSDPYFSAPIVDYRALTNPIDLEILIEFTHFTRKVFTETRFKHYNPVELEPGADVKTPAQITAWLKGMLIPSCFHPIGTAAMLPRNLGGVVNEKLLVYGVIGLSVVDASIMPDLPGSYTQQTTYAVAEKAADIIKARA